MPPLSDIEEVVLDAQGHSFRGISRAATVETSVSEERWRTVDLLLTS